MKTQPRSSWIAFVRIPEFSTQHKYLLATRMRMIVGLCTRLKFDQADVLPAARERNDMHPWIDPVAPHTRSRTANDRITLGSRCFAIEEQPSPTLARLHERRVAADQEVIGIERVAVYRNVASQHIQIVPLLLIERVGRRGAKIYDANPLRFRRIGQIGDPVGLSRHRHRIDPLTFNQIRLHDVPPGIADASFQRPVDR